MQIRSKSIITIEQIRAARHSLRWTFEDLASESVVSVRTLKTLEAQFGIPKCRKSTVERIQKTLESAGIEFIGTPEDRPGIRIGKPRQ